MLGAVDDFDDAAAMADLPTFLLGLLDPQERAVADPCDLSRPSTTRNVDADFRRRAVGLLVPLRPHRNELAVGVTGDDLGEDHGGQFAGPMQLLAPALEPSLFGELAQHVLEVDALVSGNAEGARNLALADPSGSRADERQELRFAGQTAGFVAGLGQEIRRIEAARLPLQSAAFRVRTPFRGAAGAGVLPSARDFDPRAFGAPDFRARRAARLGAALPLFASSNATASSSFTVSGVLSGGSVALTPLWLT